MPDSNAFALFDRQVIGCRKCPRLVRYIEEVARVKRRAWADSDYWGQPVPSFGPADARLLIVGLAPGAHGANRTGRVFTGDSSGNLLYRVLYRTGFASQPESRSADDGLRLIDARITCAAHCAPPGNKPLPQELSNCGIWLREELGLMKKVKVVVALGRIAFDSYWRAIDRKPGSFRFAHNEIHSEKDGIGVISSYHPSQQNTSTGRLTEAMLLAVFERVRGLLPTKW